jgi:hypothetical protein
MNLPINPIVQTYLTGWDFSTHEMNFGLYTNIDSFDTINNTVNLVFQMPQNYVWKMACGFIIAFSKSYFNKYGVIKIKYSPILIMTSTTYGTLLPHY